MYGSRYNASTTLEDVRYFDGERIRGPVTIRITDGKITSISHDTQQTTQFLNEAERFDCRDKILIPGLIDSHVHLKDLDWLRSLAKAGITTALDCGSWPASVTSSNKTDPIFPHAPSARPKILASYYPAISSSSMQAKMPMIPSESILGEDDNAEEWVGKRIQDGSDFIKVYADTPGEGLSLSLMSRLVSAAQVHGKKVVAHAANHAAWKTAIEAGVDILTHAPLDKPLNRDLVQRCKRQGIVCVPTLIAMYILAPVSSDKFGLQADYESAAETVKRLIAAGVPIFAGSDANPMEYMPECAIPHAKGVKWELEKLVEVGMTPMQALKAATVWPAQFFGLGDVGRVTVGARADLVLLQALGSNGFTDIKSVWDVERVWCNGVDISGRT